MSAEQMGHVENIGFGRKRDLDIEATIGIRMVNAYVCFEWKAGVIY